MTSALGSFEKVLRVGEGRRVKRIAEQAEYVLSLQPELEKLSDAELQGKTAEFKQRLAKRDAEWTRSVYERLGATVSYIENMMPFAERKQAYAADITYGTNSEFGFDYLRDNMAVSLEGVVQRGHSFAIVDEVDSILIDEARTPLIISGEPETAAQVYYDFARIAKQLVAVQAKPK